MLGQDSVLFVFSAKGLQSFVLGSDELRDMVGATELIDQLPRETLQETLSALGLTREDDYRFLSQAAGGARVLFKDKTTAQELAAVWPMICSHAAPGLEVVQAIVDLNGNYLGAVERAERQLAVERNRPRVSFPEITPVIARNPRSGLPVLELTKEEDGWVPVDIQGQVKRRCREKRSLYESFGLSEGPYERAPKMFEEIAGDDRAYLAIIHADGNELGQMFIDLGKKLADSDAHLMQKFYTQLSRGIEEVTKEAVKKAVEAVRPRFLKNSDSQNGKIMIWPLLPVVLAGDDLTVVLRADLAIDFTARFQKAFNEATEKMLNKLKTDFGDLPLNDTLPQFLTAGAGVSFIKRRFPFSTGYELCESLAEFAKNAAKEKKDGNKVPSTVAFHRVTASSVSTRFTQLLESELAGAEWGGKYLKISMAPYAVDEAKGLARLEDLQNLAGVFRELPRGQIRELLHLIETDASRAQKHYDRLLKNLSKELAEKLKSSMQALTGALKHPWDDGGKSPVGDAIVLAYFMEKGSAYGSEPEDQA